jgi:hypothetical protein
MTVRELQELLSTYHPSDQVVLAKTRDLNPWLVSILTPLYSTQDSHYNPETRKMAEPFDSGSVPCVIFWPNS